MALQEEHDVLDFLLLLPALLYALYTYFADTLDFQKLIRIFFDDLKRILAELTDDQPGVFRTDSFDQTAAEIFHDPVNSRWERFFKILHGELPAVLLINAPVPVHGQHTADMNFRHGTDNRHKVAVSLHLALDYRVSVLRVLICNSLNYRAKMLRCFRFIPGAAFFAAPA